MTFVFTSLVAAIISERLLTPLVIAGSASVLWWYTTGDLRPSLLIQFGSILLVVVAIILFKHLRGLWPVVALYGLSKLAECYDRAIYAALPLSGHTWKHALASLAALFILRWWPAPTGSRVVLAVRGLETFSDGSGANSTARRLSQTAVDYTSGPEQYPLNTVACGETTCRFARCARAFLRSLFLGKASVSVK